MKRACNAGLRLRALGAAVTGSGPTNHPRARDALLPLLLFPIVVPALLGSVKATTLVIEGDPMGQISGWVTLLVVFVVAYCVLCTLLFGRVVEE